MSFNDYIYWQTLQETGKTPEEIYEYEHPKVVRCKECKHNVGLTNGFWEEDIVCDYWESDGLTAYDFCSRGERKESDDEDC